MAQGQEKLKILVGRRPQIRRGFRPKKSLGQHFLKEKAYIDDILTRSGYQETDSVVEIGPGLGALTLPMARLVGHITAVEKDEQAAVILKQRLNRQGIHNVTLINDDILGIDFNELPGAPDGKIKLIGNLPYSISSPLLDKLIRNKVLMKKAVLMFQDELAKRLIASPGTKDYGALSVFIQYDTGIFPLLKIPKEAFYPKPKVDAMVLDLDFERPYPGRAEDERRFQRIVKGAFAHRRKTLLNALAVTFSSSDREEILGALAKCDIASNRRAETLSIDDFLCLNRSLPALP
jgi:16S rRNA (adenine1518-N6/adenine1519-N6)-dimethyltransferase